MASITLVKDYYMFQLAPAYKISKAALNMMTAQYAAYLEKDGFTVFSICPGVRQKPNKPTGQNVADNIFSSGLEPRWALMRQTWIPRKLLSLS